MLIVYDLLFETESSIVHFFEKMNTSMKHCKHENQYIYIPDNIPKNSCEDIFSVLSELNINIPSNSVDASSICEFTRNSNFIFKNTLNRFAINSNDVIVAPFFKTSDYSFFKELEKKCPNIAILSKERVNHSQNDKFLDLNQELVQKAADCFNEKNVFASTSQSIYQAKELLKNVIENKLRFDILLKLFSNYMDSQNMNLDEKKKQENRICNLKTYFE